MKILENARSQIRTVKRNMLSMKDGVFKGGVLGDANGDTIIAQVRAKGILPTLKKRLMPQETNVGSSFQVSRPTTIIERPASLKGSLMEAVSNVLPIVTERPATLKMETSRL